ncbi:Suppressor of tumorigenicity 7 protein-like protein, partial [Larimichthys crocea]
SRPSHVRHRVLIKHVSQHLDAQVLRGSDGHFLPHIRTHIGYRPICVGCLEKAVELRTCSSRCPVSHLRPLLGGVDSSSPSNSNTSNGEADSNRQSVSECKVWRNPLNLFRGAEYNRYTWVTGREPLTYYDMNLSAQDHQTFFTCDSDHLRPADAIMQKAWRERNPQARISAAHEALELEDCATAYILLAEEEATTIMEAERLFKQALKAGESCYRRSQQLQHHGTQYEAQHNISLPKSATICYTAALLKARAVSDNSQWRVLPPPLHPSLQPAALCCSPGMRLSSSPPPDVTLSADTIYLLSAPALHTHTQRNHFTQNISKISCVAVVQAVIH